MVEFKELKEDKLSKSIVVRISTIKVVCQEKEMQLSGSLLGSVLVSGLW